MSSHIIIVVFEYIQLRAATLVLVIFRHTITLNEYIYNMVVTTPSTMSRRIITTIIEYIFMMKHTVASTIVRRTIIVVFEYL